MELSEAIEKLKNLQDWYKEGNMSTTIETSELESLCVVLQALEELRQENEVLKFENNRKIVGKPSDYIHKDKIKEKIEEVKSRKCGDVFDLQAFMYEQEAIIEELEELLKGG